ncbi:hypothetical protein [Arthrobacter sp. 9V]|nr:hypothetical protein [Arthrobacter sp. 9V]
MPSNDANAQDGQEGSYPPRGAPPGSRLLHLDVGVWIIKSRTKLDWQL